MASRDKTREAGRLIEKKMQRIMDKLQSHSIDAGWRNASRAVKRRYYEYAAESIPKMEALTKELMESGEYVPSWIHNPDNPKGTYMARLKRVAARGLKRSTKHSGVKRRKTVLKRIMSNGGMVKSARQY